MILSSYLFILLQTDADTVLSLCHYTSVSATAVSGTAVKAQWRPNEINIAGGEARPEGPMLEVRRAEPGWGSWGGA